MKLLSSELSESELSELTIGSINQMLLKATGVNFVKKVTDLANNEKKTEVDFWNFIKENYPVKIGLTKNDHRIIEMLFQFYLEESDEHDAGEDQVSYGLCEPVENVYDKPFRSRFLRNFLTTQKDPTLVTGFFPKD